MNIVQVTTNVLCVTGVLIFSSVAIAKEPAYDIAGQTAVETLQQSSSATQKDVEQLPKMPDTDAARSGMSDRSSSDTSAESDRTSRIDAAQPNSETARTRTADQISRIGDE
jgi:hypothetical protein